MKERLIVYLRGSRIGLIEFDHDANSREFSYDAEYLASSGACPISLSLPLREKCDNNPRAVLDRLDDMSERIQTAADELAVEMSDEGWPSSIYARIGEVIREQAERVKGAST